MIGLPENPDMLERWIMTGPEISQVVEEFTGANDNDDEELPDHEQGCAPQYRFQRRAKDLVEVLLSKGNPSDSEYLVTLNNKVCESAAAAVSVRMIESIGQEQLNNFTECTRLK